MASNDGSGSTNPTNKNTKKEKVADNSAITAATNIAAGLGRDSVAETEPPMLNAVVPTGKRRRSSEVNETRKDFIGQTDSLQNGETGPNAAALSQSIYHGNASNFVPSEVLRQQQETAQNNNQFLQAHLDGLYTLPSTQSFMPPNATALMIANQLRQAGGTAPFLQVPQVQPSNELQQLSMLLQQHLYGVGLAQTLGINLPSSREAIGGSYTNVNPSYAQSSSQMIQGFAINSDSFPATLQATAAVNTSTNSTADIPPSSLHTGNRNDESVSRMNRLLDSVQQNETSSGISGRPPIPLYISCDDDSLSEYQCLVRKHIELFEAGNEDVESNAQGRNRPIVLGQVGIRCRHCTMLPPRHRSRGAIYYPAKLQGIYQAAQNLAVAHLGEHCQNVPDDVRATLGKLRERKSSAGGGKRYWANGVRVLGVFEDRDGLRFESRSAQNDSAT